MHKAGGTGEKDPRRNQETRHEGSAPGCEDSRQGRLTAETAAQLVPHDVQPAQVDGHANI